MAGINGQGLTLTDVIRKCIQEHPEWGVEDHRSYIYAETSWDEYDLLHGGRSIWQCKYPPGCSNYSLEHGRLCFEHTISLGRMFAPIDGSDEAEAILNPIPYHLVDH